MVFTLSFSFCKRSVEREITDSTFLTNGSVRMPEILSNVSSLL